MEGFNTFNTFKTSRATKAVASWQKHPRCQNAGVPAKPGQIWATLRLGATRSRNLNVYNVSKLSNCATKSPPKKKSSEFHLDETWIRRLCLNLTTLNSVRSVKKLLANPQNTGCFHEDSHGLWINPQYRKGNPSWMSTGSSRYCKLLMIRIYWDTKHYYIRKHSSIISP